ncbi:MAG TPA: polysaccharide biosynthesis/export family protein [Verrucomicrobiae bacterium]|nr:polysaccharide biosynthesis/export family protein [Verrucomicrobiae bacterium]
MNPRSATSRRPRLAVLLLAVLGTVVLLGCSSLDSLFGTPPRPKPKPVGAAEEATGRLRSGDQIQVRLDFSEQPGATVQTLDLNIDEDGEISLPLVGHVKAADLTPSELAERIQANYVPRYYVRCTATVLVAQRFFYIGGEIRNPGRFPWSEDTTLMKAISTASGFTDYANRRRVELVHGAERHVYNCDDIQRNPAKDPLVRPGDTITVTRSIF